MNPRFMMTIGLLWIGLGLFLSAPVVLPAITGSKPVSAVSASPDTSTPVVNDEPVISGQPTHIAFPRLNISVDVIPGYYDAKTQTWTLSKDKAQFAEVTSQPNSKTGNTFIYGHNRWAVFTALLDATVGDQAIITTENGHTFTYTLREISETDPSDLSYMAPHKSPILTVQTCSGLWYEHRRMLTFDLTEVQ